eukprot:m.79913 g.79913  ORF g.79913 m.79913 type:complete len:60 (+) comp12732_c1_seq2:780-959(+)
MQLFMITQLRITSDSTTQTTPENIRQYVSNKHPKNMYENTSRENIRQYKAMAHEYEEVE